jgi:hypothetical protein
LELRVVPEVEVIEDEGLPERVYQWFNSLVGRQEPVTEPEVRAEWTEDCLMITNGQLKCRGIPAFVKHFNEIREKLKSWEVELPLTVKVVEKDRIAVYYRIRVVKPDNATGTAFIGAFFDTRKGKLASMTEVAYFEGAQLALANH